MSDVEEPKFNSLAERIAALQQSQHRDSSGASAVAKKTAPLPRPSQERPQYEIRARTINNPPVSTFGSAVTRQPNNEPAGVRSNGLLPPPSIDRDMPKADPTLSTRKNPPPLPIRKGSQPAPGLPPRKSSGQLMVRRGSDDSLVSQNSAISSVSLSQSVRSSTSSVDTCTGRKLPPALGQAILPPLPPTKRELEEKAKQEMESRVSLVSSKSSPIIPQVEWKKTASIASLPRLPSRPDNPTQAAEVASPVPFSRRLPPELPPPMPRRPDLTSRPTLTQPLDSDIPPPMPRRPDPTSRQWQTRQVETIPAKSAVIELNNKNFDKIILNSGKPALVEFYAPYCRYCKDLAPIYEELALSFSTVNVIIAKCDVDAEKTFVDRFGIQMYPTLKWFDGRSEQPGDYNRMRDLESLTSFITEKTGLTPQRPDSSLRDQIPAEDVPPPVPYSSRPSQKHIGNRSPAPGEISTISCLVCRDFSHPDKVASQYPRQTNPNNSVDYLAKVLCGPFDSPTDKARAIFAWLHYNIDYDTVSFFNKTVKNHTPESTIARGLAVCGGYACVYAAIAVKAGLECVMVTGHGKGFGYSYPKNGLQIPLRDPSGHAWNAVKIDNGEWKLVDPCWGAGHLGDGKRYKRQFSPSEFTASNEDFGAKHFPADAEYFFRRDGSCPTWEEYILGSTASEPVQTFGVVGPYGINPKSFLPPQKAIVANSTTVTRFQFSKACLHWDHVKNGDGPPFCMVLLINGLDGRKEDWVPFDYDGTYWWVDVVTKRLGTATQQVRAYSVTTVDSKDARGMTKDGYLSKKGKAGMGFAGIATWDLI